MTSLSDLARKAGFDVATNGRGVQIVVDSDGIEITDQLERLLALHVQELCADAEPVAHMWQHEETGHIGFVEKSSEEEQKHWERVNKPRKFVCDLYPATTVAALQARVAELGAALSDLLDAERFSNRPPETVMQAEEKLDRIRSAAAKAHEALRSKK